MSAPSVTTSARPWAAAAPCSPCGAPWPAGFSLEQALPLERVLSHSEPHSLLLPVDTYFQDRPPLTLPPALEKKVRNGMAFPLPGTAEGEYRVYGEDGGFLALSQVRQGVLTTVKSFYEVT